MFVAHITACHEPVVCYVDKQKTCFICRYMRDPVMVNLVSNRSLIPANITHEVCYDQLCSQTVLVAINELTSCSHVVYRLHVLRVPLIFF